jgi:hypothetical protein
VWVSLSYHVAASRNVRNKWSATKEIGVDPNGRLVGTRLAPDWFPELPRAEWTAQRLFLFDGFTAEMVQPWRRYPFCAL